MNSFKNNHQRRGRYRSISDRNFKKRNGNGHKLNGDFNNNSEFKRKNPGRNNQTYHLFLHQHCHLNYHRNHY